jgi:GNAT superfamily N-acetyltransferase
MTVEQPVTNDPTHGGIRPDIRVRLGALADFDAVMRLMDDAVAWLAGQGRTGQWGSDAFTASEKRVEHMRGEVEANDLWMAEIDAGPVGAMLLGETPMPYVSPVEERELYLHLLVTGRRHVGAGIGRALVAQARAVAAERGIDLIRVDCYAGDDRKLVTAYERLGFTPTEPFTVELPDRDWPGQVLAMRVSEQWLIDDKEGAGG